MALSALAAVAVLLALVGLFGLRRGWGHLRQRRLLRAGAHGTFSSLLLAAGLLLGLGALNLSAYQRLFYERPIARIWFQQLSGPEYVAHLRLPAGGTREYVLRGQDWMLEARVLKWRGWLELLGFQPQYQLRRLSGRYADIAQARSASHTVYALAPSRGFDAWARAGWLRKPLIDALYGSAVYLPMASQAEYEVSLGRTGLIARPANAAARHALAGWG
ncbi:MAG: hypothetical protein P8Y78_13260 [Acidihalobacter sp.]|jgi:hypothetical protein